MYLKRTLSVAFACLAPFFGCISAHAQSLDLDRLMSGFANGLAPALGSKSSPSGFPNRQLNTHQSNAEPTDSNGGFASLPARLLVVEGIHLNAPGQTSQNFQCQPSDIFQGYSWCSRGQAGGASPVSSSVNMLVDPQDRVKYAAKFVGGATFKQGEIAEELDRLSTRFGQQARIRRLPPTPTSPRAVIAVWGAARLRPLNNKELDTIKQEGKTHAGIVLDFLSNPIRSVGNGLPVFALDGGAGFFWVASFDEYGSGNLKFGFSDATEFTSQSSELRPLVAQREPSGNVDQVDSSDSARKSTKSDFAVEPHLTPTVASTDISAPKSSPSSDFAAQASDRSVVQISQNGASQNSSESRLKPVEVTGFGDSIESARRDATRQAVQQAVGVFIDDRRRVEEKISDSKVSTIVEEKVLSYTNAYVEHFEVVAVNQKGSMYELKARVDVKAQPLLQTLKDNNVPTVPFDNQTAASTAQSIGQEKIGAQAMYLDLLARSKSLMQVGVGKATAAPQLPSPPNQTWLRIPLTFFANKPSIDEWREKMKLIAQDSGTFDARVSQVHPSFDNECSLPTIDMFHLESHLNYHPGPPRPILPDPGTIQENICFAGSRSPDGEQISCYGRSFFVGKDIGNCDKDDQCPSFMARRGQTRIVMKFLNASSDAIYTLPIPFQSFPALRTEGSSKKPPDLNSVAFLDFCTGSEDPFFAFARNSGGSSYLDTLVIPSQSSRKNAYLYARVSNDLIGNITSIQASIEGR